MPSPCITAVRGQTFPSQADAARYFNVHPTTIFKAIERGHTGSVGLGANHNTRKPVWLDGSRYDSRESLCRIKGIPRSSVRMSISREMAKGLLVARTKWGVLSW